MRLLLMTHQEDEAWLATVNKDRLFVKANGGSELTPHRFEMCVDILEGAQERVESMGTDELLSVDEGILLLQDEPEASVAGYIVDYWRQTALSRHNTMMYQVKKAEIVNGQYSTTSDADPYVAFRTHRTRMQTRRNR